MSTYHHNYRAFGIEVLQAKWMVAEMHRRAEKVAARAEATAPFDPGSTDGTHYKDAFKVSSGIQHHKTSRAYGRVENFDAAALWIEVGTRDTPKFRTLGKALDAASE